jgi:hypothetical protein
LTARHHNHNIANPAAFAGLEAATAHCGELARNALADGVTQGIADTLKPWDRSTPRSR